jgi:homoserine kinase
MTNDEDIDGLVAAVQLLLSDKDHQVRREVILRALDCVLTRSSDFAEIQRHITNAGQVATYLSGSGYTITQSLDAARTVLGNL